MYARLPYRDDDAEILREVAATAPDLAAARARKAAADAAWRQAVVWHRTATPKTREIRKRHLDRCIAEALGAAAALIRAERDA